MDTDLVQRAARFAPPWLRYMLTLSEAVRTGDSWVVAEGDDIALWDTDAGAVLPMWPTKELAAETLDADSDAEAAPVSLDEITERLLPFLVKADANLSLFPNYEDDMLIEPAAVAEDIADFIAQPVDIVGELAQAPAATAYDEWALLESPGVEDEQEEGWAPVEAAVVATGDRYADAIANASATGALWLLDDPAEDAVVGIVIDDRPGLAVFATQGEAAAYGESTDAEVTPRALGIDSLVLGWLLVAYGGQWTVAISPDAETAVFVEPTRLALDLGEACAAGEDE